MDATTDNRAVRRPSLGIEPDATTHDLLNDATEWLQFSRGLTELLAELIHESDTVDCHRMALGLEAIAVLTHMGLQCAAHAHARMSWEKAQH